MKLADLFENEDDWEAEVADEPWKSFKVQPREGTSGWTSFAATSMVFDLAFGVGKWGQSGIPDKGTFTPMKVSIKPDVKINYAALRDHGLKIAFFEGEEPQYRKVHTLEDMPQTIRLEKSFYMERVQGKPWLTYDVLQWLNDEPIGRVTLFRRDNRSDGAVECSWIFKPNEAKFSGFNEDDFMVFISEGQLYNALKLKWWVTNRLIQLAQLPSKTIKEGRENFGFRPEYRQFWFEIADERTFFDGQHSYEIDRGNMRSVRPYANYVEWLLNNHIMRPKSKDTDLEFMATILRLGALKGNNPITDPMVFMYNPKNASPDVRKMKLFGLKPRFLEIDHAQ